MNELQILILGSAACICIVLIMCFVFFRGKNTKAINELKVQLNTSEIMLADLQGEFEKQTKQFSDLYENFTEKQLENEQVTKQLEHRIKTLQEAIQTQKEVVSLIESQQPEDKLYSRALKLVKLGADVEEIIRECDIPRAEAEMLLAVHHKK